MGSGHARPHADRRPGEGDRTGASRHRPWRQAHGPVLAGPPRLCPREGPGQGGVKRPPCLAHGRPERHCRVLQSPRRCCLKLHVGARSRVSTSSSVFVVVVSLILSSFRGCTENTQHDPWSRQAPGNRYSSPAVTAPAGCQALGTQRRAAPVWGRGRGAPRGAREPKSVPRRTSVAGRKGAGTARRPGSARDRGSGQEGTGREPARLGSHWD